MSKENEINIAELLKDCPKGMKLWSDAFGWVRFSRIDRDSSFPILVNKDVRTIKYTAKGYLIIDDVCPCSLWPAPAHRDWSDFKVPKKHKEFKPYDKVLANHSGDGCKAQWLPELYAGWDEENSMHILITSQFEYCDEYILPYEGNENLLGKEVSK